jgi:hypothetical protein
MFGDQLLLQFVEKCNIVLCTPLQAVSKLNSIFVPEDTSNLLDDFCVLNLFGHGATTVSRALSLFFGLCVIHMDPNFICGITHGVFVLALKRSVLVTDMRLCCRWENHHAPATWPRVFIVQPVAVECLAPFSYSLPISLAWPNGDGHCYAPHCVASRQVTERLALRVKLLRGRFPHIHNYKTVNKSHRIPLKSVKNSLWSKHSITLLTSIETFGNQIGWELSYD